MRKIIKNNAPALFVAILAISLIVVNFAVTNIRNIIQKSNAAGETVAVKVDPSSMTVAHMKVFTMVITAKPSSSSYMRGYAFPVRFNSSHIRAVGIRYKAGQVSTGLGQTTNDLDTVNQRGEARIIGEFTDAAGAYIPSTSDLPIAEVDFSVTGTFTSSTVQIPASATQFYKINASQESVLTKMLGASTAVLTLTYEGSPTATPTPSDRTSCNTDADCGCALDIASNSCAIENKQYLTGRCNAPDFCSGITGRCAPGCVNGSCTLKCSTVPTATPTRTGTPTPTRTPTPGGNNPTATPTPTGTQTGCACNAGACTAQCTFDKHASLPAGVTYANPIKCSLASSLFSSAPTDASQQAWCNRNLRTKGDADGNGGIDRVDYLYYVQAVNGGQIPSGVNSSVNVSPDFNGDGEVGASDRAIVVVDLGQN